MDSIRQNKVNSLMVQELAAIFLEEGRILFPGGLITVTGVRVSPDLGIAKTYLSLFPSANSKVVIVPIEAAALAGTVGGIAQLTRAVFGDDAVEAKRTGSVPPTGRSGV